MGRRRGRRDTSEIANDPLSDLLAPPVPLPPVTSYLPEPLTLLEDRRLFHPLQDVAPVVSDPRDAADLVTPTRKEKARAQQAQPSMFSARLGFRNPDKVATCVRRQQRREVLLAKGRGGGRHRRGRRTERSNIDC